MLETFGALARRLADDPSWPEPGARLTLPGLPGAAPAILAASLGRSLGALVLLVAGEPGEAEDLFSDLEASGTAEGARYLPQRETLPYEETDPHVEISARRVDALAALLRGGLRILVTTSRGLVERSTVAPAGEEFGLRLAVGDPVTRQGLADRLARMGFERTTSVQELGDVAVRGGIIDLFAFAPDEPLRIELWDDRIGSLRHFDLLTQRSTEPIAAAEVLPVVLSPAGPARDGGRTERRSVLELLPPGTLVVDVERAAAAASWQRLWDEVEEARTAFGDPEAPPAAELVLPPHLAEERLEALTRVTVLRSERKAATLAADVESASHVAGPMVDLGLTAHPAIGRDMGRLVDVIRAAAARGDRVLILCDNTGQLERLEEILEETAGRDVPDAVSLALGSVSGGFRTPPPAPLLVLTDHEIFSRTRRLRRSRRLTGVATLESIASLAPGDYVVHLDHGIGRYAGLERVRVGEETVETLKVEYADGEILRVPHYRLDLIEKWTGIGDDDGASRAPPVHKLGGRRWKALKQRTVASIREMATELLELYAHRRMSAGFPYAPDTRWQRELESSFLYEDTPDQRDAWRDVRADMESARIMDRLVCGDVGYGKTEIAIRAAFKAVQEGKQVAVLAPTTILAEQHLHTFRERLAGFPVVIESLSRLRTRSEQDEVLAGLARGRVDVVIGTHRLLSPDLEFRDLGLLVIDEEQRFGVRHKERLKDLRRSVDVLTLTATPIPRTLQMALGGLRDLSLIETAPRDRMPVITHVLPWTDSIIRDAMRRELDRGGQVFFVHDRVATIQSLAQRVRHLLPDGRVAVAHGRMPERDLEGTMSELMSRRLDVLVATSIIENGLDVPTANTMIVHRADRFGLAQLYQLRGRVGRSHHRAYCYLLVPPDVTPEAVRRLRILEHHTDLGSGYRVALKDLQLRGAGNLLGAQQSGFAQAVGFDTYQRLLERTIRRMRGEETEGGTPPTQVGIDGEALLPDEYIAGSDQKMHLYRRLSRAAGAEDLDSLRTELRDRFGPVPETVDRLLAAARLKLLGTELGLEWIRVSESSARLNFRDDAVPRLSVLRDALGDRQVAVEVRRTQPLSLVLSRGGVEPLLPTLLEALELLAG